MTGHTVLAVPVPALDQVVRDRTAFYDRSFVSSDPAFVHAHVTVLGPGLSRPTPADLALVSTIARETTSFEVTFSEVGEFPDGLLHLVPTVADDLRTLTSRLAEAFPATPPGGGLFPDSTPHLTLDQRSGSVTPETVRATVAHLLPLTVTVERIDLQWWSSGDCRLLETFPLGGRT